MKKPIDMDLSLLLYQLHPKCNHVICSC